ncbi:hypothetical protein [Cohnella sp. WQ 127256]|uniref:hypothetical protein n=1 Tax=Cohnella sp. WQ 127256 TaxID=2938790 RepID=UPI0021175C43|nr:hypothetical protein [Cohnella sp. WQ 127256]
MALITKKRTRKTIRDKAKIHDQVDATFFSFLDMAGNRYLQIDTYGREERVIPNKISQSFQIDREAALFLIELLQREFQE